MNDAYKRQVKLLLNVLPEIAKEGCFAMHGGTAINLAKFKEDNPDTYQQQLHRLEELLAS